MRWESVADDVAMQILLLKPMAQDADGVHLLRNALIGLGSLELCPEQFASCAVRLRLESNAQIETPGSYPEWTQTAVNAHLLAAQLGDCSDEVIAYYEQRKQ